MSAITIRAGVQFLANVLIAWILLHVLSPDHLPYLWPLTAVQLALLLPDWPNPRGRLAHLAASTLAVFGMGLFAGIPLFADVVFTTIAAIELGTMGALLSRRIHTFHDLEKEPVVAHFATVVVAVSSASAALLALFTYSNLHIPLPERWLILALSHIVGTATLFPIVLFLNSLDAKATKIKQTAFKKGLIALLLCILVTVYVFSQTSFPWLFLIFPMLVMILLTAGVKGAACATPTIAAIACWATAHRLGPVWIARGSNIELHTIVLQAFLLTIVATALAVGALLDERQAAEREARAGQSIYLTLLDNAQDMILLSTFDGSKRYVSPRVKTLTGWEPEEFLGIPTFKTMHEGDRDVARAVIQSMRQGKVQHNFRYRIRCKDESFHWVEAFVRGYSDSSSGELCGYVATIRSIAALTEVEEAWSNERTILASQNMRLAELAGSDELTSLANRRTFNRILHQEVARHKRTGNFLSLLMIDIDHFKLFNDRYGHLQGDACLRQVATSLRTNRASDLAARMGGEEFAVILPDTDQSGALYVAERIRRQITDLEIPHGGSPSGIVTVSIGASTWAPGFDADETPLIQDADRALYESKGAGRNRVTATSTSTSTLNALAKDPITHAGSSLMD